MPHETAPAAPFGISWGAMGTLAASDGSMHHRYLQRLAQNRESMRDLADAVHYLGALHGRHPGVIDHATPRARLSAERDWIESAAEAFATERTYLVRIVASAGPLPSTPGHAASEAVAANQRRAIDMLAQSDRAGCATGAALALAIDWVAIREVLDSAGERMGIVPPPSQLPSAEAIARVIDALAREGAMERAMLFGAQQVFAQHRGLWDLLEARARARNAQ